MKVAVKELHEIIQSAHNKLLFDREITFATLVRHPCILQFLGVADYRSNSPLLVTELMDMSLSHLLTQEKVLGKRHVITVGQDTAYGLNYLHCFRPRPIIHRDVNPGNVMVWRQGDIWRAKLCDFGSAEFVSVNMSVNPGNPFYSAPEVNSPKQTTKVSVVLSLNKKVVLYAACEIRAAMLDG
jgi:serine/threonine protein kinase